MDKSESIKALAAALNKAQAEMSGAKKGANNPFFKSKYADLNSVVDAVRIPFAENGLSCSQFPVMEDGRVGVETILMHESGEFLSNVLTLPVVKQDPQAAGSAITYARRYALQAIAGIPAEDDDGESAMQRKPAKQAAKPDYEGICNHYAQAMQAANDLNQLKSAYQQGAAKLKGSPFLQTLTQIKDEQKARLTNG